MPYTNRSFRVLGFFLALGLACTIQGTMLWGFDGVAAQSAASCAADNSKTATSRPAGLKSSEPNAAGAFIKAPA